MKLANKAIVVTGASSGMGKAIVELFVKEGASVVAVARRTERLEQLAEALAGEAGKIVPFTGDVSKKEDYGKLSHYNLDELNPGGGERGGGKNAEGRRGRAQSSGASQSAAGGLHRPKV